MRLHCGVQACAAMRVNVSVLSVTTGDVEADLSSGVTTTMQAFAHASAQHFAVVSAVCVCVFTDRQADTQTHIHTHTHTRACTHSCLCCASRYMSGTERTFCSVQTGGRQFLFCLRTVQFHLWHNSKITCCSPCKQSGFPSHHTFPFLPSRISPLLFFPPPAHVFPFHSPIAPPLFPLCVSTHPKLLLLLPAVHFCSRSVSGCKAVTFTTVDNSEPNAFQVETSEQVGGGQLGVVAQVSDAVHSACMCLCVCVFMCVCASACVVSTCPPSFHFPMTSSPPPLGAVTHSLLLKEHSQ